MNPNETKKYNLPKVLQWIFTILQAAVLLTSLAAVAFTILSLNKPANWDISLNLSIGEFGFLFTDDPFQVVSTEYGPEVVELDNIRAVIDITDSPDLAALYYTETWPILLLSTFVIGAISILTLELFRRLFRNVSRSDSFSGANIDIVRKLGLIVIAGTVVIGAIETSVTLHSIDFINENFEFNGIKMTSPDINIGVSSSDKVGIDLKGIVFGLMILAIGEAFKQGQKVKEENDLTI